ncbi:MAG: ATP-dependent acyl-CoA ligase [Hyphomicrobiales bacterium]|nr:MAG: ATP-dependent acyl-CoA ligase [Hyphomicrobiales bacterium]
MSVEELSVMTAPAALRAQARRRPDHVFIDFAGDKLTYAALDAAVDRAANGFKALGIVPGDRVAYMLGNHSDTAIVWFGLMRLGAIVVPINTAYKGEFLRHQLADSQSRMIVVEEEYLAALAAVRDGTPDLEAVVVRGDAVVVEGLSLDTVKNGADTPIENGRELADTAMLMYTSGTTGPSKGCIVSYGYLANCGSCGVVAHDLTEDDILWIPAPMYHMGCLGMAITPALLTGSTVAVAGKFSVTNFWPEIERSKATIAFLISVMLTLVANAPDSDAMRRCHGQLRMVEGAPLGTELKAIYRERFGVKHAGSGGFGITEACLMTLNRIVEPSPGDASGKRFEHFDVKVMDDNKKECPAGVPGVVYVKPLRPLVMMDGYWNNPEATARVIQDGWFNTGDIGKFDEEGYFYFVDRDKDYLRRGGENISSFEMERTFMEHTDVTDVAVHAVLSELAEDEVKVTAVLREGAALTEEQLCRWSLDRVPHYAVPRYIEFRGELPRNMVGRVLKFELRNDGRTPATWDRQQSSLATTRGPKSTAVQAVVD